MTGFNQHGGSGKQPESNRHQSGISWSTGSNCHVLFYFMMMSVASCVAGHDRMVDG